MNNKATSTAKVPASSYKSIVELRTAQKKRLIEDKIGSSSKNSDSLRLQNVYERKKERQNRFTVAMNKLMRQ